MVKEGNLHHHHHESYTRKGCRATRARGCRSTRRSSCPCLARTAAALALVRAWPDQPLPFLWSLPAALPMSLPKHEPEQPLPLPAALPLWLPWRGPKSWRGRVPDSDICHPESSRPPCPCCCPGSGPNGCCCRLALGRRGRSTRRLDLALACEHAEGLALVRALASRLALGHRGRSSHRLALALSLVESRGWRRAPVIGRHGHP
jgi:hypothetical protein